MKKLLLLPIAAFAALAAIFVWATIIAVPSEASPSAWVCSETSPNPTATCTPIPTKTSPATQTPYVITATFTSEATRTPKPTKTATQEATQTPMIIVVTATPTPGHETRSACATGNVICGPNTGSGGYIKH